MPQLAEWMVHYPADWTPTQARAFAAHILRQLTVQMQPVNEAVGPAITTSILCSLIVLMAQCNPLYARDICNKLANAFEVIEQLDPLPDDKAAKN